MGSVCQKGEYQIKGNPNNKKNLTSAVTQNATTQKINQIKEFLTLTSQNTQSFYEADECEFEQAEKQKKQQAKSISDFQVVRGLGKGAFGQVYLVKDKIKNRSYAMKIISKDKITSQQQKIHTLSERYILQAMDHPFIVKLHYAFQTKSKLYLLVDLMPGGELFYLLRRNRKFPESVAKFYAAEILLALEYLHHRNIIYRDLKPENILLDKEGHLKLADFGLSKVMFSKSQVAYSMCGTPEYIAPEIISGNGYNHSADWFSFGSLLYDMLTGRPPFYSKNKHDILKNITTKPVPIPEQLSPEAKSILKQLFKIKPKDRLGSKDGAIQVMKHPFFEDIDFEDLRNKVIKPPITFVETEINSEGFDANFEEEIHESVFEDKTMKGALGYDGFTYFKPELLSLTGKQIPEPIQVGENEQFILSHESRRNEI